LIEIFSSGFDVYFSIAIMIGIETMIRINQTLDFYFQSDPD